MPMNEESLKKPIVDFFNKQNYIAVVEWRTPYAIPDILAIKPNHEKIKMRLRSKQIIPLNREIYWRILDMIPDESDGNPVNITELTRKLGLSLNYLKNKIIRRLERGNYVKYTMNNYLTKINGFYPYCDEIITVEAKISKWKKAGEQAIRHRLFSNRTYIALDKRYLHRAIKFISYFKKEKIGILSVDDNEKVNLILEAPFIQPTYSYLYYMILEQFWHILIKNGENYALKVC